MMHLKFTNEGSSSSKRVMNNKMYDWQPKCQWPQFGKHNSVMKPIFLDENEVQRRALKTVGGRIAEETTAVQTIREYPNPVLWQKIIPIDTRTRYELYLFLQKRTRGGWGAGHSSTRRRRNHHLPGEICFAADQLA